jgi:hypothetical protein
VADLVADHGADLIKAVAVALRKDPKDIEDLELEEFIGLVRAVVEVNTDFFGRTMRQALKERTEH